MADAYERCLHNTAAAYPRYDTDADAGLYYFIKEYAYDRQSGFSRHATSAVAALEQTREPAEAYRIHKRSLRKLGLQDLGRWDPLYWRLNKWEQQGNLLTVLGDLPEKCATVFSWANREIKRDNIQYAYWLISSINGVGPKIASLFLSNVVSLYGVDYSPIKNQHYLQPVDIWVKTLLRWFIPGIEDRAIPFEAIRIWADYGRQDHIRFNEGGWLLGWAVFTGYSPGFGRFLNSLTDDTIDKITSRARETVNGTNVKIRDFKSEYRARAGPAAR